ncbi:MAG TPA: hypothetical protein PLV82_02145 [bacterium]|nr:hypothetical protein [bacterium]
MFYLKNKIQSLKWQKMPREARRPRGGKVKERLVPATPLPREPSADRRSGVTPLWPEELGQILADYVEHLWVSGAAHLAVQAPL